MKKNNKSIFVRDWTTKKLKEEAMSFYQMIYINECYGTRDMIYFTAICQELENRKIKINEKLSFSH